VLSRRGSEFAVEITSHDWSEASYREDRAGHRRERDRDAETDRAWATAMGGCSPRSSGPLSGTSTRRRAPRRADNDPGWTRAPRRLMAGPRIDYEPGAYAPPCGPRS